MARTLIALLAAVMAIAAMGPQPLSAQSATELCKDKENSNAEKTDRAFAACDQLIKKAPKNAELRFWRAFHSIQQMKFDTAMTDASEAIKLAPKDSRGYYL